MNIAGLTAQGFLGRYLYLGYPDVKYLQFFIFLGVALTTILAGIGGSFMGKAILSIMKWKKPFSRTDPMIFTIACGLVIATVAYFLNDEILGSGKDLMNDKLFTNDKYSSWHTAPMRIIGPVLDLHTLVYIVFLS